MLRKSLSLATIAAAVVLSAGFAGKAHAQSTYTFGANCVVGTAKAAAQFLGNATKTGGSINGWVYIGYADGNSFSGDFTVYNVTRASNGSMEGKGTALGFMNDSTAVRMTMTIFQTASGTSSVVLHLYDYYNPSLVYERTSTLPLQSGFCTIGN